ncbi:hypothetical protein K458DRAFT_412546 [Lentithecium fluviatile CBS 122367]|uniref:DNA replication regulator Sld3 C-terminal domain-containing protein n=1 Tax=Lentithecium fluviatile CBS 122367 TaxID=1168545 RepID=A0A6G1JM99_9PLEO|nr:hypothetical protein K458DRAFT_412546 [Lentithecium fluviatile CBS 122367]
MSLYALQTKTMLYMNSRSSMEILGLPTSRDPEPKPRLPSKRKRDTICGLGTFNKPFTIKPCPESPYDKPHTFKPVRVIGRSQLPLSFLDTSADETLVANRLFSAYIDILEKHHETQSNEDDAPRVLIARYESKRTLYAVERVQARVYSLCRLANWLKEKEVAELWDPESLVAYPRIAPLECTGMTQGEWWKHAKVDTKQVERPTKRVKMSMMRPQSKSQPKPQPIDSRETQQPIDDITHEQTQPTAISAEVAPESVGFPTPPTPQEQLETLVEQYLNALYMSRMSLAYFAKGPIARIRNAFTSPDEGAPPTHELVTFLRSMLLSHKSEEKKYREKLQEVVKAIPPGSFSDDDLPDTVTKAKKSKKKLKLSREGVYPQEAEIVKKWWRSEMPNAEAYGEETMDQRLKRRLADLRVREALAQMILMMEIVSLENLATYKGPLGDATVAEETQTQGDSQAKPKKRKKKLDDVNLLLDLLLDKLCIWQSVEQEGVLDFDSKASNQDVGMGGTGQEGGNDRLQSFCIEVIIPFYMNRLPEQARMVNKKLGGPANTSPPKRKAMKLPTTSRKSGEPKEPDAKKSRQSLGRVATDTTGQTGRRPTPTLHRSATDSALTNGIKREGSEVPLSAIPFQRSPSNAARQSMSHMKLLKGREIDLNATSAAAAAKMKQKKRVEEDLKEAITALKKPNRGLAAGSYADEVEKRGLGLSSKSRKPANPVRRIVKDVQVSATPRAVRTTKAIVDQTPIQHHNPFIRPRETDVPPSSDFCIPSSAARPPSPIVPATVQRSATSKLLAGPAVAETPSKPPVSRSFHMTATSTMTIFATPSKHRAMSPDSPERIVGATPTKAIASSPSNNIAAMPRALFATPVKRAATIPIAESLLPTSSNPGKDDEGPSIYDALGWNDDDEF